MLIFVKGEFLGQRRNDIISFKNGQELTRSERQADDVGDCRNKDRCALFKKVG